MDSAAYREVASSAMLAAAENESPLDAVAAVTRQLGLAFGAHHVSFLIADMSGRALVRLAHPALADSGDPAAHRRTQRETATVLPFDGGPLEQALRSQRVLVLEPAESGQWTVLAPVTERGDALGLLELSLDRAPDAALIDDVARTAHVLGFVVIASRRHTDVFEWGQRTTPFTLAAEIQQRLLPEAFTCEAGSFTLSAWLEPAAAVGGDTFDYSLARDDLHLSMTDAMGHGVASALTATLCVGSLRNTRRSGATLLMQATAANAALVEHATTADDDGFATGLLGRLHLPTGVLSLVNAGHVAPLVVRGGTVRQIELEPGLPMGLFAGASYRSSELVLEPGDRVVLVTDGMLERNASELDLDAAVLDTLVLHPREATRELADRVIEITGTELADDATLLIVDWHGDHGRRRSAYAGADRTANT